MHPVIQKGDLLTVRPTKFSEIQAGDIVAFGTHTEGEDTLTTHRVIQKVWWKNPPFLMIRSDTEGWVGGSFPVYSNQLYGRVTRIERGEKIFDLDRKEIRFWMRWRVRFVRGFAVLKRWAKDPCRVFPALYRRFSFLFQAIFRPSRRTSLSFKSAENHAAGQNVLELETETGLNLIPVTEKTADMEKIFVLNQTGARIWKLLRKKKSWAQICDSLFTEYGVPLEEAKKDLFRFMEELEAAGIKA